MRLDATQSCTFEAVYAAWQCSRQLCYQCLCGWGNIAQAFTVVLINAKKGHYDCPTISLGLNLNLVGDPGPCLCQVMDQSLLETMQRLATPNNAATPSLSAYKTPDLELVSRYRYVCEDALYHFLAERRGQRAEQPVLCRVLSLHQRMVVDPCVRTGQRMQHPSRGSRLCPETAWIAPRRQQSSAAHWTSSCRPRTKDPSGWRG